MNFLKKHLVFIICILVSFIALPYGPIAGVVVGFFAELIVNRIREENELSRSVEKGIVKNISEPFDGCANLCALGVYCCQDVEIASKAAESVFGEQYSADWNFFCRVAFNSNSLNGDLLTECLANVLLKSVAAKDNKIPVKAIFEFLKLVEMNWNVDKLSEKPSTYLGNLLNYRATSDEIEQAYKTLGLKTTATKSEIKKAHRHLASQYHPDSLKKLPPSEKIKAQEKFIQIQKAYELLT